MTGQIDIGSVTQSVPQGDAFLACDPSPAGMLLQQGAFRVRLAQDAQDFAAAAQLRGQRFGKGARARPDQDQFDPLCAHLMVEGPAGTLLGTARLRVVTGQAGFQSCYTAQHYDLGPLAQRFGRGLEIGRLCLAPDQAAGADVMRLLLAGVTRIGQAGAVQVLFGCASFHGAEIARHADALAWLCARHLGPADLAPAWRAQAHLSLAALGPALPEGARGVPALLRMYLALGGFVSDHAVIDRELDTLHVLVAVPVAHIPPARLQRLHGVGLDIGSLPSRPGAPIS